MRIAMLNTLLLGGAARAAWRLHDGLRRLGAESTMLIREGKERIPSDSGIQAVKLDSRRDSLLKVQQWRGNQISIDHNRTPLTNTWFTLPVPGYDLSVHPIVQGADVINLHWVYGMISPDSVQSLQRLGKPIIWTLHDQRPFTGGCHYSGACTGYQSHCSGCPQLRDGFRKVALDGLRRSLGCIDGSRVIVVCPSRWMADCARRSALFRGSRVEVVPYGLATDVFKPVPREAARASLGLGRSPFYFLFGASDITEQRKGFKVLLDAIRLCMKEKPFAEAASNGSVRFLCFGGGFPQADVQGLPIAYLGGFGTDEQLATVYSAANVSICCTLEDNLPNTVMESMSCGTPVIGSRIGGVPDMISSDRNGLLVEAGDPRALAEALLAAWRQKDLMEAFGREARATVLSQFTPEIQARRYLEIYQAAGSSPVLGDKQSAGPSGTAIPSPEVRSAVTSEDAFQKAEALVVKGEFREVASEIALVLQLEPSPETARLAEQIMAKISPSMARGPGTLLLAAGALAVQSERVFSKEQVDKIGGIVRSYCENPADAEVQSWLRVLRLGLGGLLLREAAGRIEALLKGGFGRVYRLMVASGIQAEALASKEIGIVESLAKSINTEPSQAVNTGALMAYMLFRHAHQGPVPSAFEKIPLWLLEDYLDYVLYAPKLYFRPGEAEEYKAHMEKCVGAIHLLTTAAPDAERSFRVALLFAKKANFIPLYFANSSLKELMVKRAAILEFALERSGAALNALLPARPAGRKKIKIGFLNANYGPLTETYSAAGTMHLDREKFEICLFALMPHAQLLDDFVRSHTDQFVYLRGQLAEQVATIRRTELDVIVIGTNITAVINQVALLALHRLAPVQLVSYCSPVTTGMRNVDGYLGGTLSDCERAAAHYTEKLLSVEGTPGCMDYSIDNQTVTRRFAREKLGLPEDSIVFFSGANCFKILPELRETWARILKAVDGSRLLLHPFNPNWTDFYPVSQFKRGMAEVFARHGLDESRLILSSDLLPSRADVKELIKVCDIYLDSFPYSGSMSLTDPLELGIPPVLWEGETLRSRQGAALLRDLQLPELITTDEGSFIELAVKLATDTDYRARRGWEIKLRMRAKPPFMDPEVYGKRFGAVLESLVPQAKKEMPAVLAKNGQAASHPASAGELLRQSIELLTGGRLGEEKEVLR